MSTAKIQLKPGIRILFLFGLAAHQTIPSEMSFE
jgi:hypothetical protein